MNVKRPLLFIAFPSLYPIGSAEFCRPRPQSISFPGYISHLIRQSDLRYIQHPQWLYVCFNLLLSQQIQGRTKYLASRSPATLTQADTEQAIAQEEDSPLLRYLVNDLKVVSGLTPFWKMKRQQLKAMSDVLGPPHLFLTLTAANHEWTSLLRLLPDIIPASTHAEIRTAVIRNPHIVLHHVMKRKELFMDMIF